MSETQHQTTSWNGHVFRLDFVDKVRQGQIQEGDDSFSTFAGVSLWWLGSGSCRDVSTVPCQLPIPPWSSRLSCLFIHLSPGLPLRLSSPIFTWAIALMFLFILFFSHARTSPTFSFSWPSVSLPPLLPPRSPHFYDVPSSSHSYLPTVSAFRFMAKALRMPLLVLTLLLYPGLGLAVGSTQAVQEGGGEASTRLRQRLSQ